MAYSELIKNFNGIRDYMREFYIYGFKSREEFTKKSARSYDDARRRIESWLGDAMRFRQTSDGKNVFISIDTGVSRHNPLYTAWKAKTFTDGDITLHFVLLDILYSPDVSLTLAELMDQIDEYLQYFQAPKMFDESTVRKKLKEYVEEGIVESEKRGKTVYYRRSAGESMPDTDILDFFSEAAPCGVIGSYLLDKVGPHEDHFAFRHHYITSAMDIEILCTLFMAIQDRRMITVEAIIRRKERVTERQVVPLRIMISAQSGRQYLMAFSRNAQRIMSIRIDNIVSVHIDEVSERFDELREELDGMMPHLWGVSPRGRSGQRMEHVEFTIRYEEYETHIPKRLEREKRCGTVVHVDRNTSRFTADVFDASEMMPWIRTFISRIVEINFSDKDLEERFRSDLKQMYEMYGLEGDEDR